ncbi:hypothetical protein M4H08_001935 [Listeria monocytogenes]|nr:hypothetical protein [Listeria monocytogenes]EJE1814590.1 hypothetical protein [Listeria monocytogenes]EKZ3968274.1 hypothetical protein [Listeria monocytogenes]EKZ4000280.1 hypothetical protein [Listeria monocytogenes]EKZ4005996.1 hypothetical protein [Listeria monocytogenes]
MHPAEPVQLKGTGYSEMTNSELKAILDELGVSYNAKATKAELIALIEGANDE